MSQPPARKRDKILRFFRHHSSKTTPTASVNNLLAPSKTSASVSSPPSTAPASIFEPPEKRYLEVLATLRTVFDLADSVFDGCQIWGPKAAFSTAAKGIKALQTTFDNEGSIGDIGEAVQKTADLLARSMTTLPSTVSPELQSRISAHISELENISASTAKWAKGEKHIVRRLFDAERVAKELEGVMSKIHAANERFLMETAVSTATTADAINRTVATFEERDLLDRLRPVKEAFHNAPNASEMCLAGTRQKLLADLFAWFDDVDPSRERVLWLNGLAGTGKTTVARTIATRAHKQGRLAAAFFFSRNIAVTRSSSAILPTVAYQLAHYQRLFRTAVCTAVSSDEDVRDRGIATQADVLFSNLRGVTVPDTPLLIVLDALDECYLENGCEGGDAVPLLLAQFASVPSIKILITSRVEDTLKHMFDGVANLALHNIEADIIQSNILHYLKHALGEHARVRKLPLPFPTDDALHELVARSGKLFIYAATVVKWISDSKADPKLRLQQVLDQDVDEMAFQHKLLDGMYQQIITEAAQTSGNPLPHERALANVLSTVVLLQEPMHATALASLAGEGQRAGAILPRLSAVILVDETAPVRLFHPSFPDFITDEGRCSDKRFLVMRVEGHLRLAIRCLEIMNAGLRENICDLEDPSLPNNELVDLDLRLERAASPELCYACKYWHVHVRMAAVTSPELVKLLEMFCTSHLLHWVELLSLLGDIRRLIGSNSLRSLLTCLEGCEALRGSSVLLLLSDIARLVAAYSTPLLSHALHVYHSALTTMPLCPLQRCMPMARRHSDAPLLISERASAWGPEMKLMYDHKRVTSAAFSPDGRYGASGAKDGTIQIWDTALGVQRLAVQSDDSSQIRSIAFSPDGQVIVWGSESSMIHIWDVSARICRHTIGGHNGHVRSVAFSPDGRFVASGSSDSTVRVWDVLAGEQHHIMSGHKRTVLLVAFSPDGHSVVSGSRDHTVRVWNALDGTQRSVMEKHADSVTYAAFSSDGQRIVSGSARTLLVWDVATGSQHYVLDNIFEYVRSVEFSPDTRSVVFADGTYFVHVWDTTTGTQQTRTIWSDHAHDVYALTSSPTLQVIVGDREKPAVQVWEIPVEAEDEEQRRALAGHTDVVESVACSPDGQYIVSGSRDHTIRVWDTTTGAQRHVMSHSALVRQVTFSPNGEWIVSASHDHTLRVWDVATGAHHHAMEGHANKVNAAAFSPDGQFIVSGSDDRTVRLWGATTGHPGHVMRGHNDRVEAVAFSQDGRLVASGSADETVRLWDAATGTQHRVMSGHRDSVWTVAFSPNGQFVVSGSEDETARVWDTTTGAQWRSVDHRSPVYTVEFQPDSRSIMSYCWGDIPARNATNDPTPLHERSAQSQIADQQNATRPLFRDPSREVPEASGQCIRRNNVTTFVSHHTLM